VEKDWSWYQKLLKKFLPCNHTSSTGFCSGQFGASKIQSIYQLKDIKSLHHSQGSE
jgi:hypothetical protein